VKNITVTVDDETYRRARIKAAENDSSVSALVRDFLVQLTSAESDFERLKREERELRESIRATGSQFAASDRLPREQLYDRHALR
jgi:plasmid stability protein